MRLIAGFTALAPTAVGWGLRGYAVGGGVRVATDLAWIPRGLPTAAKAATNAPGFYSSCYTDGVCPAP